MTTIPAPVTVEQGNGRPPEGPVEPAPRVSSRQGRIAQGKSLRKVVARSTHGGWEPPVDRIDPVDVLLGADEGRLPHLLPVRYGRMLGSPFAFYRGAAAIMAADLAGTPTTGIRVQSCGDCHIMNFGGFATPERQVAFDINDFDETLPAPWEWDVKRLATSVLIVGRQNRLGRKASRAAAAAAVRGYREQMLMLAGQRELEIWYERTDPRRLLDASGEKGRRKARKTVTARPPVDDYPRLAVDPESGHRIKDKPPLIHHALAGADEVFAAQVARMLARYREGLSDDTRVLFDRFEFTDVAMKVVGVAGIGMYCGVALLMAADNDPLFLQVKEARRSVLEPFAGIGPARHQGQRIVAGQKLMQLAGDAFLGPTDDEDGRHFYVRQLRDMKVKPDVELQDADSLAEFSGWCGATLARAHARTGDAATIAGYLGQGEPFDDAVTVFAQEYAEQNERDYRALLDAVAKGVVEAVEPTAS